MANEDTRAGRRRIGRWFLRALLGMLAAGLVTALTCEWRARGARHRLDALLAEYRARGEPATVADLPQPPVADADNAAADYLAAAKLIDETTTDAAKAEEYALDVPAYLPWTDAELAAVRSMLAKSRPALDRARAAAGKRAVNWGPAPTSPLLLSNQRYLAPCRELAVRLAKAALEAHLRGDDRAAVDYVTDLLALERALRDTPRGILPQLVATGCRGLSCSVLNQLAAELSVGDRPTDATRAQLAAIRATLLDDAADRADLRRTLLKERVEMLDTFDSFLTRKLNDPRTRSSALVTANMFLLRPQVLDESAQVARWMTDRANAAATADDLYAALAHGNPLARDVERHTEQFSKVMVVMMPAERRPMETFFRARTASHAMATLLAMRLYAIDHGGKLPASLAELVPTYLPAAPSDPLAKGAPPLKFIPDPKDPRIYSVGANGKDDGGDETEPPSLSNLLDVPTEWNSPDAVYHYLRRSRPKPADPAHGVDGGE